jgi:hypothetical protein
VHAYCTRRATNGKVMNIVLWYCLGIKVFLAEFSKAASSARCQLTLSDPTSDLVRQYDFSSSAPMSEDVRRGFCCVCSPGSEPVRRFSSCSTAFSQQIAQVVLFLFLHVFLF